MKPEHDHAGNCWHDADKCQHEDCGGNVCDVCHEHEQPRGECNACPTCTACEVAS